MKIRSLPLLLLLAATACKKTDDATVAPATTPHAAGPSVGPLAVAADSMKIDKVTNSDGAIATDGTPDGSFTVEVNGPAASIALVAVDEQGAIAGQEWDTVVGAHKLPQGYGEWNDGSFTYQLGVFEGGALKNATDGSLALPDGAHHLALYAHDTGVFKKGTRLQVLVERPDHSVQKSAVVVYP